MVDVQGKVEVVKLVQQRIRDLTDACGCRGGVANVLAVVAFKNTSVLSALIISSWTLPCIMLLSTFLLKTKYHGVHFMAVGLGLFGLFLLIWGDTMTTTNGDLSPISNHSWWGDLVCVSKYIRCIHTMYSSFVMSSSLALHCMLSVM